MLKRVYIVFTNGVLYELSEWLLIGIDRFSIANLITMCSNEPYRQSDCSIGLCDLKIRTVRFSRLTATAKSPESEP